MPGQPKRDPWDVEAQTFVPSKDAITAAMTAFKQGTPVNCIQTAHMAKAASLYHPLEDVAENVVIAFDMGWDMDGVIDALRKKLPHFNDLCVDEGCPQFGTKHICVTKEKD